MCKTVTIRNWGSLLIVGAILSTLTCSCSKQQKYHPGGPYYYKSWANYYQPYRPIGEIQIDEAKELEGKGYAYYIAFFDGNGFISSFEKRYQGKISFKITYSYEEGVIRKEGVIDENGTAKTFFYDRDGNKIIP